MKIRYISDGSLLLSKDRETKLLNFYKENNIDIHSLLFAQNGDIFYEKYFGMADGRNEKEIPNSSYALHRMYSVTKSFVAIAIGLLADEGKLSLDDKIIQYYPLLLDSLVMSDEEKELSIVRLSDFDHPKDEYDKYICDMSIEDLLMMRTCHKKTTYKCDIENNWVNSFFIIKADKRAGGEFAYDTSASHVLAALVKLLSGMGVVEYIRYRIPELSLSKEAYIIKDPFGTETGGTGLMCTTLDLFKFGMLLYKDGRIDQRQTISKSYIQKAKSFLTDTSAWGRYPLERQGYGYFIWQGEHGGYMCYGMYGQFIYIHPQTDMMLITTADTSAYKGGEQKVLEGLYRYVLNIED